MSTFVDLDSQYRDFEIYPNPHSYELVPRQIETWFRKSRKVRAVQQGPHANPLEFATTVNMRYLTIPYTTELSAEPRVYVDFHSHKYNDIHLIQTIDGRHQTMRFICEQSRVQSDEGGTPIWIHYKCEMEQTLRFDRDNMITFQITTRDGEILPSNDNVLPASPDPTKQTLATFEISPYIRDNDYSNHMTETHL